ncbi:MAG: hypothetical protein QXT88_03815 [Desulfurococcaceae archaeon]
MNKKILYLTITIVLTIWFLSFIIHMPVDVQRIIFGYEFLKQPVYMDIYSDDYRSIFVEPCIKGFSEKWFNNDKLVKYCSSERVFPIPYRDYYYGKPLLTGILWLLTTSTPSLFNSSLEYRTLFFYTTFSLLVAISLVIHTLHIYKLSQLLGVPSKYSLISIISISFIIYAVYSWDSISLVFLTLFIYYTTKGLYARALFMLSLFSSMNLYGLVLVSLILYQYLVFRDREDYGSLIGFTPLVLTMSILLILSPVSFINQIMWFDNAVCNNCIFSFLTRDPYSDFNRLLMFTLWFSTYLAIIPFKPIGLLGWGGFRYIVLFIVFTNIFLIRLTPQQLLYMLPYMPLLYVDRGRRALLIHYIIDLLNSAIILLWFRESYLRRELAFLGSKQIRTPLSMDSPIQWIAQYRNITLLIHIFTLAKHTLKPKQ